MQIDFGDATVHPDHTSAFRGSVAEFMEAEYNEVWEMMFMLFVSTVNYFLSTLLRSVCSASFLIVPECSEANALGTYIPSKSYCRMEMSLSWSRMTQDRSSKILTRIKLS